MYLKTTCGPKNAFARSLGGGHTSGAWSYDASAIWIHAERRSSVIDPALNGQRPTNVPNWVLRANVSHALAALPGLPGLHLGAHLSHEGRRAVLPDGSLQLPSWTRVDASLRYQTRLNGHAASWTLVVENLLGREYFKESPYQYGHVYLFPGQTRTVRLALQANF